MKLSSRQGLRRRDLIQLLGGAALALPCLELFEGEARAQVAAGAKSKFVVFCYTPDGVNQSAFWPTGTTTSFQLSPILSAFQPFIDKILILGPQMNGATPVSGTGLTYTDRTPQHQAPVTLSARIGTGCGTGGPSCIVGSYGIPYLTQTTAVNRIDGPSIDQVIAPAVKADSPFASLEFGLHPIGGDTPSDLNFAQDGTSIKRMEAPDEAWNRVFGMPVMGGTSNASELHRLTALTNYLHGRFAALSPQLSAYDRQLLDGHLTALRTYEGRKANLLMGQTMACTLPMKAAVPTDATSVRTGADTETLSPFFMDIISTAFACNITKVASVTFGYPGGGDAGGLRMPWLGFTDALHSVSHYGGDATKLSKYTKMSQWIASQVAYLMTKLAATPDGTGKTLLDQTTIYWFNRHGDGNAHSNTNLPNIILGGTGGYFKMGRYLQLPATNPTQVLISIANAMGVNVPTFGEKLLAATSPLAGLTG
jgi:hypothetical protein